MSNLIEELARDLEPVPRPPALGTSTALWWLSSWAIVVVLTLAVAPLRPGFLEQLASSPHFLVESMLGLAAGGAAIAATLARSLKKSRGK